MHALQKTSMNYPLSAHPRDEQEPLSTTLLRLQLLITPLQATTVPQGFRGGITPKAYFYRSTTPSSNDIVPDDLPCRQALEQARMLVLDNTHYILEHYTPEITSAKVHGRLYVGLPYTVHAEVQSLAHVCFAIAACHCCTCVAGALRLGTWLFTHHAHPTSVHTHPPCTPDLHAHPPTMHLHKQ